MTTCANGHQVDDGKRFCGECGAPIGDAGTTPTSARPDLEAPANAEPVTPDEVAAKKSNNGCLWVIVAIIAFAVIGSMIGGGDGDDSGSDGPDDYGAFEICKTFVKRDLKAPGTATFRNFFEEDGEVRVTGAGDGPYTVRSSVDAQNGFGAQIRTDFTCVVKHTGGGNWHLESLNLD